MTASTTSCSGWRRRPRSRSPAVATRSSASRAGGDPADVDHRLAPAARGRGRRLDRAGQTPGVPSTWPEDAVVVCSFGDASPNHATAQSAPELGGARAYRGDSVRSSSVRGQRHRHQRPHPGAWVEQSPTADRSSPTSGPAGTMPLPAAAAAAELAAWVREAPAPGVQSSISETVRYLSHAGADVETVYRSAQEIRADYDRDPLLAAARWLVASGSRSGVELADEYLAEREAIRGRALEATRLPQLASAADVVAPLAPRTPDAVAAASAPGLLPADPMTLAQAINASLGDVLQPFPRLRSSSGGRRPERRCLRGHAWPAGPLRGGARVRHPPRRDPRSSGLRSAPG